MPKDRAISEAFCTQLDKVVSIDDAIEAYNEEIIPAGVYFRCADAACRVTHNAKISCVCCFTDPCGKPKHFCNYRSTVHSDNCIYGIWSKAVESLLKPGTIQDNPHEINLLLKYSTKDLDPANIVDDYTPDNAASYMDMIRQASDELLQKGTKKEKAIIAAIKKTYRTTTRLDTVVTAFELLSVEDRDIAQLSIPNRGKAAFSRVFRRIDKMKSHYETPYMMYGEARVYNYKKDNCFRLFFTSAVYDYYPEQKNTPALCTIFHEDLSNYRFGKQLQVELEHCAVTKKTCCAYILGTHVWSTEVLRGNEMKSCVVISPNSLRQVVIRNRCVK